MPDQPDNTAPSGPPIDPFPPKQSPPVVADDPAEPPAWNPIEEGFKPLGEKE